jgi:hypothetical protein
LKQLKYVILIACVLCSLKAAAQKDSSLLRKNVPEGSSAYVVDSAKQRDMIDVVLKIIRKDTAKNARLKAKKLIFSVVPAFGYSLTTGFAADVTANVAFHTGASHNDNLSAIDFETLYDTKDQLILASRSEVWFDANKYKLTTDLRFEKYPIDTYGLGTDASTATTNPLVYHYIRAYGTFFKQLEGALYGGLGIDYDYHYGITQAGTMNGTVSDYTKYGYSTQSTSSGVVVNLLFDNRLNPINPLNGGYASLIYRDNFTFLGSDNHWQELSLDVRRYIKVTPDKNNNVLALWGIMAFTNGNVPYLDLPYTASDTYNNSGRGYPEQRFRGRDELYLEGEYRFGILKNGLLGGVVFTNAETFTGLQSNAFQKIAPAAGTGIRVKINKHSNTNVCIDYAVGMYGSKGLFVNLGEMF